MLSTIVLVSMQQQNYFMQKSHRTSHCAQYTHKKYNILRCCSFSQQNIYIYTSQHHYICFRKHSLKIRPNSQKKLTGGVPFWQQSHSRKLSYVQYTHKTYKTKQHCEVHLFFSLSKTANMYHINMFTIGNTHLKSGFTLLNLPGDVNNMPL